MFTQVTRRGLMGRFFNTFEARSLADVEMLAQKFDSDQALEEYPFLGHSPAMREWTGGRQKKVIRENIFSIRNKKYETSIDIPRDDVLREKYGQIAERVDEMADKAADHVGDLLTDLIIAGESTACYDGQFFFDTDHEEGQSGAQSNDITIDLSDMALPTDLNTADADAPSAAELSLAVQRLIRQIITFKDDTGSFINRNAKSFHIKAPINMMEALMGALGDQYLINAGSNPIKNPLYQSKFKITYDIDPALTWTTKLACFRTDGRAKPFIWQEEESPKFDFLGENTTYATFEDAYFFGLKAKRAVGYGYWQHACLGTLQA